MAQSALILPDSPLPEILFPEGKESTDKSVLSFTPALCASVQASLCVRLLTGRPVKGNTLLYFDLLHQDFENLPLC